MPSEFDDPDLAPIRARQIGRRQILRWALVTAAVGAGAAWLGPVLGALGVNGPPRSFSQDGGGDGLFVLQFLSGAAPPFLAVGAGLALAATVEVRRAMEPVKTSTKSSLWLAWGLLALAALGFFFSAGNP
jgi:hypothetical protein